MSDHPTSMTESATAEPTPDAASTQPTGDYTAELAAWQHANNADATAVATAGRDPHVVVGYRSIAVNVTGLCGTCLTPIDSGTHCGQRCAELAGVLQVLSDVGTPIAENLPPVPTFDTDTAWRPLFPDGELDARLTPYLPPPAADAPAEPETATVGAS